MNRRRKNVFAEKLFVLCVVIFMISSTLSTNAVQASNGSNGWSQYGKNNQQSGKELGEFDYPNSVTTDNQGNVYVADSNNNRIQKLDVATGEWRVWGKSDGKEGSNLGEFNYPADVAVDSSGNIYVADKLNHRIQKLDITTGTWSKWGKDYEGPNFLDNASGTGRGEFHNPSGVAVDRIGNVYVADTTNQRLQKLDVATGQWSVWGKVGGKTGNMPSTGKGLGEFYQPAGVAVDGEGNVYVADTENHRIQKLKIVKQEVVDALTGAVTYVDTYEWNEWKSVSGSWGGGLGEFNEPFNLEVDSQGNVYVADSNNHRIHKLTVATNDWSSWGKTDGSYGSELGEFDYPTGVAVDSMGNVYVADFGNNRIQKFSGLVFTVKFDAQGGNDISDLINIAHNTKITAPDAPTRTGYIFDGWYKDTEYKEPWDFTTNTITSNLTLYAKWTETPTYLIESISNQIFREVMAKYTSGSQETKSITITRIGTGDLENLSVVINGPHAGSFEMIEPIGTKLNQNTPSTTFTIKAKDGLVAGTYTANITVKATHMNDFTFNVTQIVKASSNPGPYPKPEPKPEPEQTPSPQVPSATGQEEFIVDIHAGIDDVISKTWILRTTDSDGTVKDNVTLTAERAKEAANLLKDKSDKTARIVIPDEKDKVSETTINIPKTSIVALNNGETNLSISTVNGTILIPYTSFSTFTEDLYFRVVPVKKKEEKLAIETRAKLDDKLLPIIKESSAALEILGHPMTIETNMQSRPVTLILPIPANTMQEQMENLVVFIEHSNGMKEVVRGRITQFNAMTKGVAFDVDHFSTFTVFYLEGAEEYFTSLENGLETEDIKGTHYSYINGFSDGTFQPNAAITRQQMAAMLARQLTQNEVPVASTISYRDIQLAWAHDEIEYVRSKGIMTGTTDNIFAPNDSITRAQMAVIAMRWIDKQCADNPIKAQYCKPTAEAKEFFDVTDKHWAAESIARISQIGIMAGMEDGTFHPEQKLTRAQAVKVLNRLFERGPIMKTIANKFRDVPPSHWAYYEIQEAAVEHVFTINEGKEYIKD